MGCIGCTVSDKNGSPKGCKNNGGCSSGGCNRLNTFDWLSSMDIVDTDPFGIVEVTFKNGARKGFYRIPDYYRPTTGDRVVVETGNGYDLGRVCLSGELVRLQMRKKNVSQDNVLHSVVRQANQRDLDRLQEARDLEIPTMIRARVIARTLGLEMKIGDVEYQGDRRKATFYYTADGRVDFRELIRHYAKEFRVKIEMRQIGARQESARIGGMGSCGRELCCSTWLTDFKSVSTAAARYQNLAINQAKLSGQCGRLKCCLNYELDTYLEALDYFPKNADKLETVTGIASLIKTDIFKKVMYYAYDRDSSRGGKVYPLTVERVREVKEMNQNGEKPIDLNELKALQEESAREKEIDFEDISGVIELPEEKRKRKKKKRKNKKGSKNPKGGRSGAKSKRRRGGSSRKNKDDNKN
jgi:cell fate regulator YaaT (PSP1 superfamily)